MTHQHRLIEKCLEAGITWLRITRELDVTVKTVWQVSIAMQTAPEPASPPPRKAKRRQRRVSTSPHRSGYQPTPEEIAAACYALRMARPDEEAEGWLPPGAERPLSVVA